MFFGTPCSIGYGSTAVGLQGIILDNKQMLEFFKLFYSTLIIYNDDFHDK